MRDQLGPIPGLLHGRQDVASYLRLLVENLTHLEYLDLSGTALVGADPNDVLGKEKAEQERWENILLNCNIDSLVYDCCISSAVAMKIL